MPALIKNCFARAASLFWQWSPRGAGIKTTNSRTGNEQAMECPRFGGQLSAGLSGPAERLFGHAKEAEVPKAVSAGVSA
jgi:hypothetical protein